MPYDREMRDALTLESKLAQSIAERVEVTVTGEEHRRLSSARPVAPMKCTGTLFEGHASLGTGKQRCG